MHEKQPLQFDNENGFKDMDKKLIMMRGLPGSGKTTWARKYLKDNKRCIRVNKDELRPMLHGEQEWSGKQERLTNHIQGEIVSMALIRGYSVIVDNTNLFSSHYNHWKHIADSHGAKFEVQDFLDTPISEILNRNKNRSDKNPVDESFILNMAFKLGLWEGENKYVIFDLDGTLADISKRKTKSTMPSGKLNWDEFFDPKNIQLDIPRYDIFWKLHEEMLNGNDIVIVSGRSDRTRRATIEWLKKSWYNFCMMYVNPEGKYEWSADSHLWVDAANRKFYSRLLMRANNDSTPDNKLKKKFLDEYLDKARCVKVYDDRKRVIDMWKGEGLDVVNVSVLGDDNDF